MTDDEDEEPEQDQPAPRLSSEGPYTGRLGLAQGWIRAVRARHMARSKMQDPGGGGRGPRGGTTGPTFNKLIITFNNFNKVIKGY